MHAWFIHQEWHHSNPHALFSKVLFGVEHKYVDQFSHCAPQVWK